MKYIIAGGRDFTNYQVVKKVCEQFTDITEVVSGCAHGADILGENFGHLHNIPVIYFPAKWDEYGKSAGFIRNAEMADYADAAICFWDGISKGTAHMIKTMKMKKKPYYIFDYNGNRQGDD